MFDVVLNNQARKFLKSCPAILSGRFAEKMEDLRIQPFPTDTKRVFGFPDKVFRVRLGDYRILYQVDHARNVLSVIRIEHRGHSYD